MLLSQKFAKKRSKLFQEYSINTERQVIILDNFFQWIAT